VVVVVGGSQRPAEVVGECRLSPGGARQHHAGDERQQASAERQKRRVALLGGVIDVRVDLLKHGATPLIIHRRSTAERGGCFQRHLFVCRCVCLFVCQFVSMFIRTITSERLT